MSDGKRLPLHGDQAPLDRLLDGDSATVIDRLKAHLEEAPGDEVAWLQLGTAYLHIRHWAEAADALREAVACDGSVLEARRSYAAALTKLRRFDEAAFQLVQARRIAPDDALVARELGIAFYDKRLYDKALRELERACQLSPDDAHAHYAVGLCHEARGAMADAIAAYRAAVQRDASFIEARCTLADALAAMGEINGAALELEEALRRDRHNAQVALNLEVLRKGLRDLGASRWLGKPLSAVDASMVVTRGALERQRGDGNAREVRFVAELAELWLSLDAAGAIVRAALSLPDPARAAATRDHGFEVTVMSEDGRHVLAEYATAITVTFLRETLGCPLTRASTLYAELLETRQPVRWAAAQLSFVEIAGRPGLSVALVSD